MKLRRLSDRLVLYNWVIAFTILALGLFEMHSKEIFIKVILLQVLLISVQFTIVILTCRAFDKRHNFSRTIADQVYSCISKNIIPTTKAIEDSKKKLRSKYGKFTRTL